MSALTITITTDAVDGVNWQAKLDEAFLLAVDVSEGLRPAEELLEYLQTWWYEVLE